MADTGYIRGQLGAFEGAQKSALDTMFTYLLGNLRFGLPGNQKRAENFQLYEVDVTTPSSTGEFSVAHGLATAPRFVLPVLDVTQTGNQFVALEVTRPADSKRLYLKSTAVNAPITLFVESR